MTSSFFTIGHSNRSLEEFLGLLAQAKIQHLADVRKIPKSRTNPQFNHETLPAALAEIGIGYEHIAALGGRRGKAKGVAREINALWTNGSFHNYADYALSEEFSAGLEQLLTRGHECRTVIMCSEAVWWRCHRRIVTDYLIARGETVCHIMAAAREGVRLDKARMTPGAVPRPDGAVVYPPLVAQE